ncbi:hypothetical protein [Erysipelothrix tonsillarum]|uniref:hypothetical protein n=1 Tax=Erysipelothrix tonsillarum TaxID=38402 RepID=UPI00039FEB35|nr:hypothetical protein [Erysipelothrix tonsillarum]
MQTKIADGERQELAIRHFADYVSYTNRGNYRHAKRTRLICEGLEKLIYQMNQRIVIEMAPRHSKSIAITEAFPSCYLCKHPENVSYWLHKLRVLQMVLLDKAEKI